MIEEQLIKATAHTPANLWRAIEARTGASVIEIPSGLRENACEPERPMFSNQNARRVMAVVRASMGLETADLETGIVAEMIERLRSVFQHVADSGYDASFNDYLGLGRVFELLALKDERPYPPVAAWEVKGLWEGASELTIPLPQPLENYLPDVVMMSSKNARRIMACAKACEMFSIAALEAGAVGLLQAAAESTLKYLVAHGYEPETSDWSGLGEIVARLAREKSEVAGKELSHDPQLHRLYLDALVRLYLDTLIVFLLPDEGVKVEDVPLYQTLRDKGLVITVVSNADAPTVELSRRGRMLAVAEHEAAAK